MNTRCSKNISSILWGASVIWLAKVVELQILTKFNKGVRSDRSANFVTIFSPELIGQVLQEAECSPLGKGFLCQCQVAHPIFNNVAENVQGKHTTLSYHQVPSPIQFYIYMFTLSLSSFRLPVLKLLWSLTTLYAWLEKYIQCSLVEIVGIQNYWLEVVATVFQFEKNRLKKPWPKQSVCMPTQSGGRLTK